MSERGWVVTVVSLLWAWLIVQLVLGRVIGRSGTVARWAESPNQFTILMIAQGLIVSIATWFLLRAAFAPG